MVGGRTDDVHRTKRVKNIIDEFIIHGRRNNLTMNDTVPTMTQEPAILNRTEPTQVK